MTPQSKRAVMNSSLFVKEVRSNLLVMSFIFLAVTLYVVSVVAMFDPGLQENLDAMMESMPAMFAAFGMSEPSATLLDFILNYLYGFLLTLLPFVFILILINKIVVKPIERGTMAYLLATPNSRISIATTLAISIFALLALLMLLTIAVEVLSAAFFFPGDLDTEGLLYANFGLFSLWIFLCGMCFLSACAFSHSGAALWAGGGLGIVFFLMQMISDVSEDLSFLNNLNPLTLFDYFGLAAGETSAFVSAFTLLGLSVVLFSAAIIVFSRKDLSI